MTEKDDLKNPDLAPLSTQDSSTSARIRSPLIGVLGLVLVAGSLLLLLLAWLMLATSTGWITAAFLAQGVGGVLGCVAVSRPGAGRILGIVSLSLVGVLAITVDSFFFYIMIWPT